MTLQQGIHLDVPTADYFADPCPAPSLTQSVAKILLEKSPLHAWHAHPRLNPDYHHDDDRKFDIGNIAHKLMIGRGKEVVTLEFDDWRTKAAKEARDMAASAGKLAVLSKHYAKAEAMVRAAREQLEPFGLALDENDTDGEVVCVWEENGIYFRTMIDLLSRSRTIVADYKTSSMSCAPHGIGRMMESAGWHIQAAMHERGLDILDPKKAGRRRHLFLAQEDEKPYAMTVVELSEGPLTMGRKMLQMAVDCWRHAIENNRWPGYPAEIVQPQFPGYAETKFLEREVEHHERRKREPVLTSLMGG